MPICGDLESLRYNVANWVMHTHQQRHRPLKAEDWWCTDQSPKVALPARQEDGA